MQSQATEEVALEIIEGQEVSEIIQNIVIALSEMYLDHIMIPHAALETVKNKYEEDVERIGTNRKAI